MREQPCANGVARHFVPEGFQTYAAPELAAAPPWAAGVCFNPACGRDFAPSRSWQIYCCAGCERQGVAELRRWGHRMALPLLVWRMGKYAPGGSAAGDLTRAARRYVAHAQSAWLAERLQRGDAA
ncbi:hypothetical protein [Pseudotabrizicola sp. 4114]|uniref:hypothetical protein n=1 Tax=Pseudotabrizicola sp. 4114 TaxID=2817731 RepID=UPI00286592D6|nr:hypothetical protein [Pseudorhodobacter sp. 4114]